MGRGGEGGGTRSKAVEQARGCVATKMGLWQWDMVVGWGDGGEDVREGVV